MFLFAYKGVHDLLMSLEANAAKQTAEKAAEKYRQHQITLLQQQVKELESRRDQLKNVVTQMSSDLVHYCYVPYFVTPAVCTVSKLVT